MQKPSNANFSCRTLNGSYPVSVMFSYCLIGSCHGSAFLYLYVIASHLGEEAAILEGILLEGFETLLSPILGLRLVLGEFLQQGLGRLPGELRSG